ncbi:PBECR2 nuclease fold domain-containing protein [Campylobacter upsaliensis]
MMILKSSLKRSKFNSNTLRLINDFMQNLDAFNVDKKARLEALREQREDLRDIKFNDAKGIEHTLTKEIQKQWLDTFHLKSIDEAYISSFKVEVKEALGGKELRLQLGSLKKLVSQKREQFIPEIKAVLDEPEMIIKDSDNAFLFIKHLNDNDYFVNVSVDKREHLVSISNGLKEVNNLKNKLNLGAKIIYQSPTPIQTCKRFYRLRDIQSTRLTAKV